MRTIIPSAFFLLYCFFSQAQNSHLYGSVMYEVKFQEVFVSKLAKKTEDRFPETVKYNLKFTTQESEYRIMQRVYNLYPDKNDTTIWGNATMELKTSNVHCYCNLSTNKEIRIKEHWGEIYLVEAELKSPKWEITDSSARILNHRTVLAKAHTGDGNVQAWFANGIPVSTGPDGFGGLPGLILKLEKPGKTIVATSIVFADSTNVDIKPPVKGKRVTPGEFNAETGKGNSE